MPRYIDEDGLKHSIWEYTDKYGHIEMTINFFNILLERNRADAVEVVRCKDCIYSSPFDEEELKYPYRVGEWRCEYWGYAEMHEDDYCSCGKRRKDETDS